MRPKSRKFTATIETEIEAPSLVRATSQAKSRVSWTGAGLLRLVDVREKELEAKVEKGAHDTPVIAVSKLSDRFQFLHDNLKVKVWTDGKVVRLYIRSRDPKDRRKFEECAIEVMRVDHA